MGFFGFWGTTSLGLGLFQNRFNFQERNLFPLNIFYSRARSWFFLMKRWWPEIALQKLQEGYTYYQRCKMIVLEPNDFSLLWSYLKK